MTTLHKRAALWTTGAFATFALLTALLAPRAALAQTYTRAGASVSLSGTIRDIDRNDNEFRLEPFQGNHRITITVRDAQLESSSGRRSDTLSLRDLNLGDTADVEGRWVDRDTVRATRVLTPSRDRSGAWDDRNSSDDPAYDGRYPGSDRGRSGDMREERTSNGLTGVLIRDTGNSTRTVRVQVLGREIMVDTPRGIRVTRDGEPRSIHELKQGDTLRVRGNWQSRDRLQADRIEAFSSSRYDGGRYDNSNSDRYNSTGRSLIGTVEQVDTRNERFRLSADRADGSGVYTVDASDATFLLAGRTRRLRDLREGDHVRVIVRESRGRTVVAERVVTDISARSDNYRGRDDSAPYGNASTLGGRVESMDTVRRTFRLRSSLMSVLVRVPSGAALLDDRGRRIRFSDLNEGDTVQVIGARPASNGMFVADRVEVNR